MNKYAYMRNKYACAVVGARGYSGLELSRLLFKHPATELAAVFATDAGFALSDYLPERAAETVPAHAVSELERLASGYDTVFLATPAEVSIELAPMLLGKGCRVIDLSGAFRLKGATRTETLELYRKWYGLEHAAADLVARAEFGLAPWAGPATKNKLISNPGCYATSVLMAVIPLLKAGVIEPASLVIDAKSGTTGAGRKSAENLMFTEVEGECLPYKVAAHQHLPEIISYAAAFGGGAIDPLFTTSLIGVRRGIIAGIYGRLSQAAQRADDPQALVEKAFASAYAGYPLARVTALTSKNERQALSLKKAVGSARVHIGYKLSGDKIYVFSLIDNLLKGAAGQAVENFNRLHDLAVETGLIELEGLS